MPQLLVRTALLLIALFPLVDRLGADELQREFESAAAPILAKYCHECHAKDTIEAEIDFGKLSDWKLAKASPDVWLKVREILVSREMPPPDANQPSDTERLSLLQWVRSYLTREANSDPNDPGPSTLRRLNNSEYRYTIQDLTGIVDLDPTRQFPVDGAAGEGFTNAASALPMSPALVSKYLEAGKEVASHAVFLPDGMRFSRNNSRRDWTNEILDSIREFYQQRSVPMENSKVALQGLVWESGDGRRIPIENYLRVAITEREAIVHRKQSPEAIALKHGLSPRYFATLCEALTSAAPSTLLARLQSRWKEARPEDVDAIYAEIVAWQRALWKFNPVGHIGKVGGPKTWQESVTPMVSRQDFRIPMPAPNDGIVGFSLIVASEGPSVVGDAGTWERPRFVAPGKPDLLLRDLRSWSDAGSLVRADAFDNATRCLEAVSDFLDHQGAISFPELASKHGLDEVLLAGWFETIGLSTAASPQLEGIMTTKVNNVAGYDYVRGWGSTETPHVYSNASDQLVRIPGNAYPKSVVVHPAPTQRVGIAWKAPSSGAFRVGGVVHHAHPECGNGVRWTVELRRGRLNRSLATGTTHGDKVISVGPIENVSFIPGDLLTLTIGAIDRNHSCDLTKVDLTISELNAASEPRMWNLAADVATSIDASNPHRDGYGEERWTFFVEPDEKIGTEAALPEGSLLANWITAESRERRAELAGELQALLTSPESPSMDLPDGKLRGMLASLGGPLMTGVRRAASDKPNWVDRYVGKVNARSELGLDAERFGKSNVPPDSIAVPLTSQLEVRAPFDLIQGYEFVTGFSLQPEIGKKGIAQAYVGPDGSALRAGISPSLPIVTGDDPETKSKVAAMLQDFRDLFPAAVCYSKIVPTDEVITLSLFYREDGPMMRYLLTDAERAEIDRLWHELHFVSEDAFALVDAFKQLLEYASQDANPKEFIPLREPITKRASDFAESLVAAEPAHLREVLKFAERAWRRPLRSEETKRVEDLYFGMRRDEHSHDQAIRLTMARILVAPEFLYRMESAPSGAEPGRVSAQELAIRLSYLLWASAPDQELLSAAAAHARAKDSDWLPTQTKRMLADSKVRRMADEFGCQWLHIRDFAEKNEKSEKLFPTFAGLRSDMHEEAVALFTDLFQRDRSILDLLLADDVAINGNLAAHYELDQSEKEWRRVTNSRQRGRGGILTLSSSLATQSGASRTSPILRGAFVSETLLGERLPRPPKNVPVLPEETPKGLSERELTEMHSSEPACAKCHAKIDPYGFALENFDAIGRYRELDADGRPINARAQTPEGVSIEGWQGLSRYIAETRRDDFVRQFSRKLLGYSLGRKLVLSDEPLVERMMANLASNEYRVSAAITTIIESKQFQMIRGQDRQVESAP